jgi:hypothetical protein
MGRRQSHRHRAGRQISREWGTTVTRICAGAKINEKLSRGPLTVAKRDAFDLRADSNMTSPTTLLCLDRRFSALAGRDNE